MLPAPPLPRAQMLRRLCAPVPFAAAPIDRIYTVEKAGTWVLFAAVLNRFTVDRNVRLTKKENCL